MRAYELALPGRTGIDALALLDKQIAARGVSLMAIIDDCHHLPAAQLAEVLRAAPGLRWLLLGRPCNALAELAASMLLPRETLGGWDDDVIAALLRDAGGSTRPEDVSALRTATRGAPLFVLHAVRAIAGAHHDTGDYARALVAGTTTGRTPQEALLEGAVAALDPAVGLVASALASIEIALPAADWVDLLAKSVGQAGGATQRALRALVDIQIAQETEAQNIAVHDAFRPLLEDRFLSHDDTRRVREEAAVLLRAELLNERASERIVAYARILASLGRLSQLAELANALSEWIRDTGTISEIRGHLEAALAAAALSNDDRFWALDTLAFFDIEDEHPAEAAVRLPEMERLAVDLDDHARGAWKRSSRSAGSRSREARGDRRFLAVGFG